jgi:hypothetical protein
MIFWKNQKKNKTSFTFFLLLNSRIEPFSWFLLKIKIKIDRDIYKTCIFNTKVNIIIFIQ